MPRGGPKRAAAVQALAKSRQTKDSDDEESEWEQDEESQTSSSQHADKEDSSVESDTKPPAKKRMKKRKPLMDDSVKDDYSSFEEEDESHQYNDDDLLPSYARKTVKGGYAHTNASRARISKANKGNTPWNKGKNRSASTKAKIAAGVRARNRKMLLTKLQKLNMTEDEWLAKKKEIKYLRERIRKAKKAADAKEAQKQRKGKDADKTYEELQQELSAKLQQQVQSIQTDQDGKTISTTTPFNNNKSKKGKPSCVMNAKEELLHKAFTPHITWTRHDYDLDDGLYQQLCPTGGPGGLACCHVCSFAYSNFLNQTSRDMDIQATHNAATEVQECLQFMDETRNKLHMKMNTARTQPIPLMKPSVATASMMGVPTASV